MLSPVFICKFLLLFTYTYSFGLEKLELVHVLYRHGDRAPVRTFPNDPNGDESNWPEGFGELTKRGKQMEYKLGGWLRNRYGNFISETFSSTEVNVLSTDYDRTLMSGLCVLAAFYYPDIDTRFNVSFPWMPTPIHTAPEGSDVTMNVDAACPRIAAEVAKVQNLPIVKEFLKKHETLLKSLTTDTGEKINSIMEMGFLYDTLYIEQLYNFTLPNWTHNIMHILKEASDLSFQLAAYSTELKRLRAGPLLQLFVDHMQRKIHGNLTEKLFMYSGHDSTVATTLHGMNVFNNISPPYSATVLIELYSKDKEHYIKTFYRNDTNIEDPILLTIPGCSEACPLSEWIKLVNYSIPQNWDKECNRHTEETYYVQALSATILSGILVCALFAAFLCLAQKNRQHAEDVFYQKLLTEEP